MEQCLHIRYICLKGRLVYFSLLSHITKLIIEYLVLNTREGKQTMYTAKVFYGLKYEDIMNVYWCVFGK